jgi:hypothetical protein
VLQWLWPGAPSSQLQTWWQRRCTAWLLVVSDGGCSVAFVGEMAPALFLLLGDPGIQRSAGLYVRGHVKCLLHLR